MLKEIKKKIQLEVIQEVQQQLEMQLYEEQYKPRYNPLLSDPRLQKNNFDILSTQFEQKFSRNNEILNYEIDTNTNNSHQIVEYQIQDQIKSNKDTILVDKFNQLKEQEEQINIEDDILDFLEKERYFNDEVQRFCLRCKFTGHNQYQCNNQLQRICLICLSDHIDHCIQVACFRCNEKGHIKLNCQVFIYIFKSNFTFIIIIKAKKRYLRCDCCHKYTHSTNECGMILFKNTNEIELVKCLNCFQYGHINCSQ